MRQIGEAFVGFVAMGLCACGGSTQMDRDVQSDAVVDASTADSVTDAVLDASIDQANDAAQRDGSNQISGSVIDGGFSTVATAFWIGMPDSPQTTVVYLFDHPVMCSELSAPGWDRRITDMTQALEMKMIGTTLQVYTVVTGPMPGPGEASVNHTLTSQTVTPVEMQSQGGTVTLISLNTAVNATGTFDLTFSSGGMLRGSFDATWCAVGTEP